MGKYFSRLAMCALVLMAGAAFAASDSPVTSGLIVHIDASDVNNDDGATQPADGADVTSWKSTVGAYDFTGPAGGTAPKFVASSAELGGAPALAFDGGNTAYLAIGADDGNIITGEQMTIFYVGRITEDLGGWRRVFAGYNLNANGTREWQQTDGFVFNDHNNGTSVEFKIKAVNLHSNLLGGGAVTDAMLMEGVSTSPGLATYQRGVESNTGSRDATPFNVDYFVIGAGQDKADMTTFSPNNGARCQIAEILIFDRALTDLERNQVGGYLEAKYGFDTPYADPLATGFKLYDGTSNAEIKELAENDVIDIATSGTTLNIEGLDLFIAAGDRFGFYVDGVRVHDEGVAPWFIGGDVAGDPRDNWDPTSDFPLLGCLYDLSGYPLDSSKNINGTGTTVTLSFIDSAAATAVTGFRLVNAGNNNPLQTLTSGDTIDLANVGTNLSINCGINNGAGQVEFSVDGQVIYVDDSYPFHIAGGDPAGWAYMGLIELGQQFTVSAQPLDAGGAPVGTAVSIDLTFVHSTRDPKPAQIAPEIVAHWVFDSTTSGTVLVANDFSIEDLSGNGNDLAAASDTPANEQILTNLEGPPILSNLDSSLFWNNEPNGANNGTTGNAHLRTDSSVTNPSGTVLENFRPSQVSIEAIFKPTGIGLGWQSLICMEGRTGVGNHPAIQIRAQDGRANENMVFVFGTDAGNHVMSYSNFVQNDHWFYICMVIDGEAMKVYGADLTNGEEVRLLTSGLLPGVGQAMAESTTLNDHWRIGNGTWNQNNGGDHYMGNVAEIKVWNGAIRPSLHGMYVPVELDSFVIE